METQNIIGFDRSEYVPNKVLSTSVLRHYFQEQDNLRGKKILSIDTYQVGKVAKTPQGDNLLNATAFKDAFLVLVVEGSEKINRIPLVALDPTENSGRRIQFRGIVVDFAKSYVEYSQTANLVANEAALFNFYFQDKTCEARG